MKTTENKTDMLDKVSEFASSKTAKVILFAGGAVLACYASIFVMNLMSKVIISAKGLENAIKS